MVMDLCCHKKDYFCLISSETIDELSSDFSICTDSDKFCVETIKLFMSYYHMLRRHVFCLDPLSVSINIDFGICVSMSVSWVHHNP